VQEIFSKSREHRLRVLEHQARVAAERSAQAQSEPQRKIPLLVEVKPAAVVEKLPRAGRGRTRARAKQARFEGL
jgi:hypothetical protein